MVSIENWKSAGKRRGWCSPGSSRLPRGHPFSCQCPRDLKPLALMLSSLSRRQAEIQAERMRVSHLRPSSPLYEDSGPILEALVGHTCCASHHLLCLLPETPSRAPPPGTALFFLCISALADGSLERGLTIQQFCINSRTLISIWA